MYIMTGISTAEIEAPGKQIKEYYRMFDLSVPGELVLQLFSSDVLRKM